MKILITGFKPFLGESQNPSEMLSIDLALQFKEVTSLILPVEFEKSFNNLRMHLADNSYSFLILLGQASGRKKISLEKIALNWVQTEHSDEAGAKPEPHKIMPDSPLALMTNFTIVDSLFEKLKDKYPMELSFSAGTYVCNDLYFRALCAFPETPTIFIHVPLIESQILADPSRNFLEYSLLRAALSEIVQNLLDSEK